MQHDVCWPVIINSPHPRGLGSILRNISTENRSEGLPGAQAGKELAVLCESTFSLFVRLVISNSGSQYIINQSSWRKLFLDYTQVEQLHEGFQQLPRKKFKDIKACDNSGKLLQSPCWKIVLNMNGWKKCLFLLPTEDNTIYTREFKSHNSLKEARAPTLKSSFIPFLVKKKKSPNN